MSDRLFKTLESAATGTRVAKSLALEQLSFNQDGLIPAIAQQHDTGEVLMMAWMNREALEDTLATGRVCYWSRSRQKLWRKGESSGNQQRLVELLVDCDGDTVLVKVEQTGAACHSGRRDCFYNRLDDDGLEVVRDIDVDPAELYGQS